MRLRNGLPAVTPDRAAAYAAAAAQPHHSFRGLPEEAWPLFLSAKQYMHMLDGGWAAPVGAHTPVRCPEVVVMLFEGPGLGPVGVSTAGREEGRHGCLRWQTELHSAPPLCLVALAGTLRTPFFKRRADGGFYYESGASRLLLCKRPTYLRWPDGEGGAGCARKCRSGGGLCRQPQARETDAVCGRRLNASFAPLLAGFIVEPAEARDDEDGMSQLVDLAGASGTPAAGNGGGGDGGLFGRECWLGQLGSGH